MDLSVESNVSVERAGSIIRAEMMSRTSVFMRAVKHRSLKEPWLLCCGNFHFGDDLILRHCCCTSSPRVGCLLWSLVGVVHVVTVAVACLTLQSLDCRVTW